MAATGNEVARLEQLKGLYPQVITLRNGTYMRVTLGNGRQISFRNSYPGTSLETRILARVMYNSIELLQAASDYGSNVTVEISCDHPMNLFTSKLTGNNARIYILNFDKSITMATVNAATNVFKFDIDGNQAIFLGTTIYVD